MADRAVERSQKIPRSALQWTCRLDFCGPNGAYRAGNLAVRRLSASAALTTAIGRKRKSVIAPAAKIATLRTLGSARSGAHSPIEFDCDGLNGRWSLLSLNCWNFNESN